MTNTADQPLDDDARRLAQLGYRQELKRTWSGFSNFAISFSIISILSGCFTTFGTAWNNGGPIAISWGWPIIATFILIIGFCMSELVSAYPTAGGIYWWASKLGRPIHGWYTGWLNLIGLIAVTASVDYGCATFLNTLILMYDSKWSGFFNDESKAGLSTIFVFFAIILVLHSLINIFGHHLVAVLQNISVWWHVAGAATIIGILVFVPSHHQSASWVFTHQINNSGFAGGKFWFYILPLGFLLTQYTITGFDACAHVSEETQGAAKTAARGLWQSIFYSAIGGYVLLLAMLFASTHEQDITKGAGSSAIVISTALSSGFAKTVILISVIGQFYCGMSCVTAMSRMTYAFSRDQGVPGHRLWSKVDSNGTPRNAIIGGCVAGFVLTLPALYRAPNNVPVAFNAVVSIAVIGLYLAFMIPIALRLRAGDSFEVGPWTLGNKYKWMCWAAVLEIIVVSVYFIMPTAPQGIPGQKGFDWKLVNYSPIVVLGTLAALTIWWFVSARTWFTGPRRTIEESPESNVAMH
jgi:amino acid transporter